MSTLAVNGSGSCEVGSARGGRRERSLNPAGKHVTISSNAVQDVPLAGKGSAPVAAFIERQLSRRSSSKPCGLHKPPMIATAARYLRTWNEALLMTRRLLMRVADAQRIYVHLSQPRSETFIRLSPGTAFAYVPGMASASAPLLSRCLSSHFRGHPLVAPLKGRRGLAGAENL
jgi:hypothetical protein